MKPGNRLIRAMGVAVPIPTRLGSILKDEKGVCTEVCNPFFIMEKGVFTWLYQKV
jgi:hypothetical protein